VGGGRDLSHYVIDVNFRDFVFLPQIKGILLFQRRKEINACTFYQRELIACSLRCRKHNSCYRAVETLRSDEVKNHAKSRHHFPCFLYLPGIKSVVPFEYWLAIHAKYIYLVELITQTLQW
jgi:hypothetical protein